MNPHVFREYDIRGVVDEDFPPSAVESLGRAIGTHLLKQGKARITVGRDVRLSSDRLREDLVRGLLRTGLHVIDVGVCPTPLLYFSIRHLQVDGGAMITGSHNPPEFNGFKICSGPDTIFGEEIQSLREIVEREAYLDGRGEETEASVSAAYRDAVLERVRVDRPVRVVLDAGNGTAGPIAMELLQTLGCEAHCLYCEPDGHFPNHHPDPTIPAHLDDLRQAVLERGAELGVAFDGDADRIGVLDERGEILWGDRLLILFARALLREHPGACVVGEVKCSRLLYDDIARNGGRPVMWKAGHSLMKGKMKEEKALLAGEMSGHLFFADRYFGFDDALYAACRLIEILSQEARPLSALLADLPETFSTPEIRLDCPDTLKFEIIDRARAYFRDHYEIIDVDGVRIEFPDGWGLVRASNTQPVLVLRFEAESLERREQIQALVEAKIREIRASLSGEAPA